MGRLWGRNSSVSIRRHLRLSKPRLGRKPNLDNKLTSGIGIIYVGLSSTLIDDMKSLSADAVAASWSRELKDRHSNASDERRKREQYHDCSYRVCRSIARQPMLVFVSDQDNIAEISGKHLQSPALPKDVESNDQRDKNNKKSEFAPPSVKWQQQPAQ